MKPLVAMLAAAGIAAVMSLPAKAEGTARANGASSTTIEHSEVSAAQRRYRGRHYGHRYRPYAYRGHRYGYNRRYGYYRPYGYHRPYYAPGVSLGFGGGPRLGVWF